MGKKLAFRIKVEMVESEAEPSPDRCPQAQEDGSFSLVLPESDELNISALDRAALDVSFPALREALWRYLAEAGEKTSAPSRAPELGADAYGRKAAPIRSKGRSGSSRLRSI
jgi:hypothetical protein